MPAPTDRLPDVRCLIYEIERLRCAAVELREATDDVMNNAWEDGAREERQNVVAWLRAETEDAAQTYTLKAGEWANRIVSLADSIERGEHVKVVDE